MLLFGRNSKKNARYTNVQNDSLFTISFSHSCIAIKSTWMRGNFGLKLQNTVEPRFNEPLFNEVLDITNDILGLGQSYSKMYGIEPRYNEPRYNEFLDITNIFRKPKRKIYLDITKCNVNTREKINAEQINSQQIF